MEITSRAACASRLHREALSLELYFQRIEDEGNGSTFARLSDAKLVVAENFTSIEKRQQKWTYPCSLFDLDGSYQALLRSSSGTTLTVSTVMAVTFSASFNLNTRHSSVFPCPEPLGNLDILYTYPACASQDLFRVYKLVRQAPGSAAGPLDSVYIGEFQAPRDQISYKFNCSLFHRTKRPEKKVESSTFKSQGETNGEREESKEDAMGFCFAYVTQSRFGAVKEQKRLCLPSHPDAILSQDGGWSAWTSWTTCSVTCGSGMRNRFRMCNNPPTEFGGRFCPGQSVQWTHCEVTCPDAIPRTPLHSPTFDPGCYCGCTRADAQAGEIIASGRCTGLATWIIKAAPGQKVTLTFRYFDIVYERQWVKVRDGERESDDLLFFSHDKPQPSDVTSPGHVMRVELMTQVVRTAPAELTVFPFNASLPIHVHGFIASYAVTELSRAQLPPPLFRHVESRVMESDVTIVGIALCSVLVVALVVFAVVQRVYWRRTPKYSAAQEEESPRHLVHSSSAQSSQPSSPGPQVQVDMDIPLTGGPRRKNSSGQPRQSRTASISSTCSQTLKKIRGSMQDNGAVTAGGSPKPSAKVYTNLSSPYADCQTIVDMVVMPLDEDLVQPNSEAASFFPRNSPILKQVAPRSPKVHPHRFRTTPSMSASSPTSALAATTPGESASPSLTKLEMLTRKRQEKKDSGSAAADSSGAGAGLGVPLAGDDAGEREVTGSSGGSGSSSKPAFTYPPPKPVSHTTTTKAEINLIKPLPSSATSLSSKGLKSPADPKLPSLSKKLLRSPTEPKPHQLTKLASSAKRRSQGEAHPMSSSHEEEIPLMDSAEDVPQSTPQHLPSAAAAATAQAKRTSRSEHVSEEETSFITGQQLERHRSAGTKVKRPTSLSDSYSLDTISSRGSSKASSSRTPKSPLAPSSSSVGKPSAIQERQTLLPKPDGQSPKSHRELATKTPTGEERNLNHKDFEDEDDEDECTDVKSSKSSSSSPSKSSLGGKSSKTLSPTRSIATPELEYDDFIMDDPLSYFEYDDLSRLNWTGTEKLGHSHQQQHRSHKDGT